MVNKNVDIALPLYFTWLTTNWFVDMVLDKHVYVINNKHFVYMVDNEHICLRGWQISLYVYNVENYHIYAIHNKHIYSCGWQ